MDKKISKHLIFFSIAVFIANVFLSYVIGVDEVLKIISEPISIHVQGFIALIIFSSLFYGVFAFFREQVCVAVCPYGRLQGVLLVKSSIVVLYDWVRGEPRGRIKKQPAMALAGTGETGSMVELPVTGDCVDCSLCVKVCPTGIDMRHGTQLECVNCTACMDACDEVMRKVGREEGLIRYDSVENVAEGGKKKLFNTRVLAYSGVLVGLLALQAVLLTNRSSVESLLLRTPGTLYQEVDDQTVSNLYSYQIVNKSTDPITDLSFRLVDTEGTIKVVGKIPDLPKQELVKGSLFIEIYKDDLDGRKTRLKLELFSGEERIDALSTNFLGPVK